MVAIQIVLSWIWAIALAAVSLFTIAYLMGDGPAVGAVIPGFFIFALMGFRKWIRFAPESEITESDESDDGDEANPRNASTAKPRNSKAQKQGSQKPRQRKRPAIESDSDRYHREKTGDRDFEEPDLSDPNLYP